MSVYRPDRYVLIEVVNTKGDTSYRVFGTWFGGYAYGDSWRINSGITKVEVEGDTAKFYGSSGSVYIVNKDSVGTTGYTGSVLGGLVTSAKESGMVINGITLEELCGKM